jgi:hypothetical protein
VLALSVGKPFCQTPVSGSGLFTNNLNNNKMKLEIGMKFTSKWFEGTTEILAINEEENTLDVEIHREDGIG